MADISVLQIGEQDWTPNINQNHIEWHYTSVLDLPVYLARQKDPYILEQTYVVLTDHVLNSTLLSGQISDWPAFRTIYFTDNVTPDFQTVLDERRAFKLLDNTPEKVSRRILDDLHFYQIGFSTRFNESQFEPYVPENVTFKREGRFSAQFDGDFGNEWQQIGQLNTVKNDFSTEKENVVWLDYDHSDNVEVQVQFVFFKDKKIQLIQTISGESLTQLTAVGGLSDYSDYKILIFGRGHGQIDLHVLHQRYNRHGLGLLMPGDNWDLTPEREEILSYFNPGDRKGPLIVNFSGLRLHVDGFEMLGPLRDIGTPYLLFTDARMQGGAFNIGSENYESKIIEIIHQAMDELNLSPKDVILTGYSMGSFPAMYYAADIKPGAIVVAKPIVNIGTLTENPEFPRAFNQDWTLDLRRYLAGRMDPEDSEGLNQIFWEHIGKSDFSDTDLSLFTMAQDEYDGQSLPQLISFFQSRHATLTHHIEEGSHTEKIPEMIAFIVSELVRYRDNIRQEAN